MRLEGGAGSSGVFVSLPFSSLSSPSRVFCCFAPPTLPGYVSSPTLTSLPMPLPLPNHIYPASYTSAFSEEPVRA